MIVAMNKFSGLDYAIKPVPKADIIRDNNTKPNNNSGEHERQKKSTTAFAKKLEEANNNLLQNQTLKIR